MSRISQIKCDAPKCNAVKTSINNWWVLRDTDEEYFACLPMSVAGDQEEDVHICSTPCMHAMLEKWMQSHMDQSALEPGPRCTCKDTYEVGSGATCPVHEADSAVGIKIRKEINDRERVRIADQAENWRREEERINRPA